MDLIASKGEKDLIVSKGEKALPCMTAALAPNLAQIPRSVYSPMNTGFNPNQK